MITNKIHYTFQKNFSTSILHAATYSCDNRIMCKIRLNSFGVDAETSEMRTRIDLLP